MANEVVLNALLWDILKKGGIDSQAEERNADGSKTDIRCAIGDCVIAVEAEHGDSSVKKKSANQDAGFATSLLRILRAKRKNRISDSVI